MCLKKTINQEEKYCTIKVQEIKQNGLTNVVRTEDLQEIFSRNNNCENVRFIELKFTTEENATLGYTGLLRKSPSAAKSVTKRKTKTKVPLVPNKKQCFIPTTTRQDLQKYINQNWPTDNDTKDQFCKGIDRLLDIQLVSSTTTLPMPKIVCEKESQMDDVRSILHIVQQKFPNKFELVRKALSDIDE